MAGLAETIDPKIDTALPDANAPDTGAPSLPLYAAGAVITLCGILAANAALTAPDYGWMLSTVMLAGLGFLFSYGSRRLGIAAQTLDYGFAAVVLILLALVAAGQIPFQQLLPLGADRPDLRLLSALVWGGTVWAWALRSDNRVMGTTVPTMAVLGMAATIDVNTPVLVCFGTFILTVIFLLIHQNFLLNQSRSAGLTAEPKPRRLLLAQCIQAGLCGLVVLLIGALVIIPAQVVFSHLSLTQAIRQLAAIQTDPNNPNSLHSFSDDDNLAIGTGDAWSSSADVVMRVTPSDRSPHYWRGRTYDLYTGDGWQSSQENDRHAISADPPTASDLSAGSRLSYTLPGGLTPGDLVPSDLAPGDAAAPAARRLLTTIYEVRGQTNQFYYADAPRQVQFDLGAAQDDSGVQICRDGRLGLRDGRAVRFRYGVVSLPPPDLGQPGVPERLRVAGTGYPADVRALYLAQSSAALPEDVAFYRQCVAEALQALPPNRRDPFDEAAALRDWVSRRCVYTLTLPALPEGTDHVHAFLGDTRKGYCDLFASSLAVLCRTAGIPARLAVGFAPGDPDGASFNLRAEDKHAWTEVYFPGTGWIAFDATAGTSTDGTVPSAAAKKSSWLSRFSFGLSDDWKLVYPLVGLILAIAAYIAKTELYDPWRLARRAGPKSARAARTRPGRGLATPYGRLSQALARLGLPRRESETPAEYAARVLPLLPPLEREWGVALPAATVSGLSAAFAEACYADPSAATPPTQPWDSRVAAFEAAAKSVARQRFWRRLTRFNRKTAAA